MFNFNFVNLTPHAINMVGGVEVPPSGRGPLHRVRTRADCGP